MRDEEEEEEDVALGGGWIDRGDWEGMCVLCPFLFV